MSLDQQLKDHLREAANQLTAPEADLDAVVSRGRRRRVLRYLATAALASIVLVGAVAVVRVTGTDESVVTDRTSTTTADTSTDTTTPPAATATVDDLTGEWRAVPLIISDAALQEMNRECLVEIRDKLRSGLPLMVADARGEGQVELIYAGADGRLAVCDATVEPSGQSDTEVNRTRGPGGQDPPLELVPVEPTELLVEGGSGSPGSALPGDYWKGLFGRAGTEIHQVVAHVTGLPPVVASLRDGWFSLWWPVDGDSEFRLVGLDAAGNEVAQFQEPPTISAPSTVAPTPPPPTTTTFVPVLAPGDATCAGATSPASLQVGKTSIYPVGAGDYLWVDTAGTLTQVDLRTRCVGRKVALDPAETETPVFAHGGSLWLSVYPESLREIDIATGEVISEIPGVSGRGGMVVVGDAFYAGACPLGQYVEVGPIARIDLEGHDVSTFATTHCPTDIAAGFGSLWAGSIRQGVDTVPVDRSQPDSGALTRIDLGTGRVVDDIPMPGPVYDMAVSADAVWLAEGGTPSLVKVDPQTMEIVKMVDLESRPGRPLHIDVDDNGDVWVAGEGLHTTKIDGETGEALLRLQLNSTGSGLTVVDDHVYITAPHGWLVIVAVDR